MTLEAYYFFLKNYENAHGSNFLKISRNRFWKNNPSMTAILLRTLFLAFFEERALNLTIRFLLDWNQMSWMSSYVFAQVVALCSYANSRRLIEERRRHDGVNREWRRSIRRWSCGTMSFLRSVVPNWAGMQSAYGRSWRNGRRYLHAVQVYHCSDLFSANNKLVTTKLY